MPSVRIRAPRTQHWLFVAVLALQCLSWIPQALGWTDHSARWRLLAVVVGLLTVALLVALLRGVDDTSASADGLHRSLFHGRGHVAWTDVTEIRPAPGNPERLVIRGASSRTIFEGQMPTQDEVGQLHTWHRAALEQARPGDTPDENGSGVHVRD